MFADDVQLYYSCYENDINYAVHEINVDLAIISDWASYNKLILNVKKTQAIVFSDRTVRAIVPNGVLNNVIIPYSKRVLNLGHILTMDTFFFL